IPIFVGLAAEYTGKASFGSVDADHSMNLVTAWGVRSVPTILVFKDQQCVDKIAWDATSDQPSALQVSASLGKWLRGDASIVPKGLIRYVLLVVCHSIEPTKSQTAEFLQRLLPELESQ